MAKDVCNVLGYSNTSDAVSRHYKAQNTIAFHDGTDREQGATRHVTNDSAPHEFIPGKDRGTIPTPGARKKDVITSDTLGMCRVP